MALSELLLRHKKLIVLFVLIIIGISLSIFGLFDVQSILKLSQQYANTSGLVILLILLQAIFFTFALAGSLFLWVVAVLYTPFNAAIILALGATLGGIGAYYFSRNLTMQWVERVQCSKLYHQLQENDNFFTLLSLRLMPAFPHAIVNYSSGILRVNLFSFISSALIGVGLKSYLFSNLIYQAFSKGETADLFDLNTLLPLVLSSLLIIFLVVINILLKKHRSKV